MIKTIVLVLLWAFILFWILGVTHYVIRANRVHKFRMFVFHNYFHLYGKLPISYSMVYDGKPLKLESYFTKEQLNEV